MLCTACLSQSSEYMIDHLHQVHGTQGLWTVPGERNALRSSFIHPAPLDSPNLSSSPIPPACQITPRVLVTGHFSHYPFTTTMGCPPSSALSVLECRWPCSM